MYIYIYVICISIYIYYIRMYVQIHMGIYVGNIWWMWVEMNPDDISLWTNPAGPDSMFYSILPLRFGSWTPLLLPFWFLLDVWYSSLTNILWDEDIATPLSRQWPPGGRGNVTNLRRIRRSLRVESTGEAMCRKKMTGWLIYARNLVLQAR